MRKSLIAICLALGAAASLGSLMALDMGDFFRQPLLFVLPFVALASVLALSGLAWVGRSQ